MFSASGTCWVRGRAEFGLEAFGPSWQDGQADKKHAKKKKKKIMEQVLLCILIQVSTVHDPRGGGEYTT